MHRFFSILLIMLFYCSSVFTQNQWEILNQGTSGFSEDADFVGDNGWIAGYTTLLKSEDGGQSWFPLELDESLNIYRIDFVSENMGWAYGYSLELSKNVILATYNGGQSWEVKHEIDPSYATDIYAFNQDTVFVLGGMFVLKTVDAFKTFNYTNLETALVELRSVDFAGKDMGIAVGGAYGSESFGYFFKTGDAGKSWQEVTDTEISDIYSVRFAADSTFYFVARDDSGKTLFCKTDDFFKSWNVQSRNETYSDYIIYPLSKDTVFSVTSSYSDELKLVIEISYDSGIHWQTIKELPFWGIKNIHFQNGIGLITGTVGGGGFINQPYGPLVLRSDDNGYHWDIKYFSYPFLDVQFLDDMNGFAVGGSLDIHHQAGEVFVTRDGGTHWEVTESPGSEIPKIQFVNNSTGFYLVGVFGRLFRTTNSGQQWIKIYENNYDSTGVSLSLSDFQFTDENKGYMAGSLYEDNSYACIIKTETGGKEWSFDLKIKDKDFKDIFLFDENNGWAVGSKGLLAKLDGGVWKTRLQFTDKTLTKVYFSDDNNGWISSGFENMWYAENYLLRTTDGGDNWDEVENFNYIIEDIIFDGNKGWMVGADTSWHGVILYTENNGDSWEEIIPGLSRPLHAIYFNANHGWVVGDNGLVLRSDDGINWIEKAQPVADEFKLYQNYPNPFNPKTMISYQLPVNCDVNLSIYSLLGQKVATLVDEKKAAGQYKIEWNASNFASGVYLYKLKTGSGYNQTRKLVLLK